MLELECAECGDEAALLEDDQVVERSVQPLVIFGRLEEDEHAVVMAGGATVHLSQGDTASVPGNRSGPDRRIISEPCAAWSA